MHASSLFEDLDPHFLNVKQNKLSQSVLWPIQSHKEIQSGTCGLLRAGGILRLDESDTEENKLLQRRFDTSSFVLPIQPLVPLGLKRVCLRVKGVGGDVVCASACVCLHVYRRMHACVCARGVIAALESMLSGVGGVTRLDFWTLRCMDQMVHYTPVWQSNCSLYTAYKHTCTHQHICTRSGSLTHAHTLTQMFSLFLSVRTERSSSEGLDSHNTRICQIDNTAPR